MRYQPTFLTYSRPVHFHLVFTYNEHVAKLNKDGHADLIDQTIAALNELGLDAHAEPGTVSRTNVTDATIMVRRQGKTYRFAAEVKRRLTPSMVGLLSVSQETTKGGRVIVTDYVTPPIANELRRRDVQFADAAGNAFLNHRDLFVFVTGRRPDKVGLSRRPLRVFQASGVKVLFAILSAPELLETQRRIASAAGVALGTVPAVLDSLTERGYLVTVGGKRRIVGRERLLQQWTEAYATVLDPSLDLGRFSATNPDWWQHADLTEHSAQWGGETAASILQGHLVPERIIVYSDTIPHQLLSRYRLRTEPLGRVSVRQRFWNAIPSPRQDVVPPLLIYADLMTAGDARSIDAARKIRDAYGL